MRTENAEKDIRALNTVRKSLEFALLHTLNISNGVSMEEELVA